ncbi:hypothetical protein IWW38_006201, partial [Coemansia aciculifera]
MSLSTDARKGKEREEDADNAGPYIMRPLAIGLRLGPEDTTSKAGGGGDTATKGRRQSLSQRLGFGANKDKEQSTKGTGDTTEDEANNDTEASSVRSSSPPVVVAGVRQGATALAKAECIDVVGSDMYVGTSHGHIAHYTVSMPELDSPSSAPECFCVGTVDLKLGGKRVEHLLAFPVLNRLVVLCGSTAQVLSLPDLRVVPGTTMKGVTCLSYDERVHRSTAAVAIL